MRSIVGRQLYYYQGSLTTPDCDEVVHWFVMKQIIGCNAAQLLDLTRRVDSNYRNIQPRNGRAIWDVNLS